MLSFTFFILLQIISESFPVSSSGHVMLMLWLIKLQDVFLYKQLAVILSDPYVMFALHAPTALVIIFFYAPRWYQFIFHFHKHWRLLLKITGYTVAANLVTIPIVLCIKLVGVIIPLWVGFLITFMLLISTRKCSTRGVDLSMRHYLLLGAVQGVAYVPGVSRLATVYAVASYLGLSGKKAFDISWLLQFPLLCGAAVVGWMGLLIKQKAILLFSGWDLIVMAIGSIVAFAGCCAMNSMAKRNFWWLWAIYIIIPLVISAWYYTKYCF